MNQEFIISFGAAIIAPILAYLKVRDERNATKEKRDTDMALVQQDIKQLKQEVRGIDELKHAINSINQSLVRIETILEFYAKKLEKKEC
jgi:Tfp pilus assembly protein PilN